MTNLAQLLILTGIILTIIITIPTLLIFIYLAHRRAERD